VLCASPQYLEKFGTPRGLEDLDRHRLLAAEPQTAWRLDGPDVNIYAVHPGRRLVPPKVRAFVDYFARAFGPTFPAGTRTSAPRRRGRLTHVEPQSSSS
jgi:DNA-binding transcriptional LysR family regulator